MLYEFFDTKEDNRLSWIGKERDKESLLGDFGARKYDFLLGGLRILKKAIIKDNCVN
jgi:hypothetical protein